MQSTGKHFHVEVEYLDLGLTNAPEELSERARIADEENMPPAKAAYLSAKAPRRARRVRPPAKIEEK